MSETILDTPTTPFVTAEYAGFWWRVLAAVIDAVLLGIAASLLSVLFENLVENVLGLALQWIYFASMESSAQLATIGKRVCGLVVVDLDGRRISFWRATGRFFAKILSALIFFIGYLMVAFKARKQGLHDMLAGTLVLKQQAPGIPAPAVR